MTERNGTLSTGLLMTGLAAISVLVAVWIFVGGGDDESLVERRGGERPSEKSEKAAGAGSPERTSPGVPGATSAAGVTSADANDPSDVESVPRFAPALGDMPDRIAEDFLRETAPISVERRELMERGMEEMPDRVRKDFENAPQRPIPPDVLEDFQNPYPKIPDDEYQKLIENGRTPGAS